jgi:hypothetical protein
MYIIKKHFSVVIIFQRWVPKAAMAHGQGRGFKASLWRSLFMHRSFGSKKGTKGIMVNSNQMCMVVFAIICK